MSWTKNLLLVITSIVLSLVALEFGLRLIYPEKAEFQNIRDHSDPFLPKHVVGAHVHAIRNSAFNSMSKLDVLVALLGSIRRRSYGRLNVTSILWIDGMV